MFNFLKHSESEPFDAGILGRLFLTPQDGINCWNGWFTTESIRNRIEIAIETREGQPTSDQITKMGNFFNSYKELNDRLIFHIHNCYENTEYFIPIEQISKMYSLAAVTLKTNNDFWVVLEPGDVYSVYNHFMRFTIRDEKIIWSNIE